MLPSAADRLWCLKYRPTEVKDYAFSSDSDRELTNKILSSKSIPHLLLSGPAGTGKSTLAFLLAKNCINVDDYDTDVLVINASDNNSVDDMRELIKNHITSFASGSYKLVILQEADYLTPNAQGILRDYMEVHEAHARFILTCNALHKIDKAIASRCQRLVVDTPDKKQVALIVANILVKENVKIPNVEMVYEHIDTFYPDVRSIIQSLQQNSSTGTLRPPSGSSLGQELRSTILTSLERDDWMGMAKSLPTIVPDYAWDEVYEIFYTNIDKSPSFNSTTNKWGDAILTICEYMVQNNCSKPAINGAAFCVQMSKMTK